MVSTAITTAVAERGPVVISVPGDVAVADAPSVSLRVPLPATTIGAASAADLAAMADLINQAETVAIFGGDGCAQAQDEVRELAARLKAPVGYSLKGKPWLEHDNPNAVGMTGLLGYGGCHSAISNADVLLMLGTDFPFTDFRAHWPGATGTGQRPGRGVHARGWSRPASRRGWLAGSLPPPVSSRPPFPRRRERRPAAGPVPGLAARPAARW